MTLTAVFESLEDMMDFAKVMAGNAGSEPVPVQPQTIPVAPVQPVVPITPAPQPVYTAPAAPIQPPAYTAPPAAPVPVPVPTTAPSYTLDNLTRAAIPLMDSGKQPALLQLLKDFGVEALPALQPEQYGAFATALRGLGAQI